MSDTISPAAPSRAGFTPMPARDDPLMAVARKLESAFLSEMLGYAGLGRASQTLGAANGFSGGIGERQFASFLRNAQADAMVAHGGIGLAESLYHALKERANDPD